MPPVDAFREVDAALRTVVTLGKTTWDTAYMRDDVANAYSEADLDAAYRELMATQTSSDDFNRLIEFGDLEAQIYLFEELVAFQFPTARYESIYVSYDRAEPFPFFAIADVARAHLDAE